MSDIRIGIICEGASDYTILEWCLREALERIGHKPTFHAIHPIRDKTSGAFEDGGWHQVYKWCVRNDQAARRRFFGAGLFDDDDAIAVDLLIVHIDGDVHGILGAADRSKRVTSVDPANYHPTPKGILAFGEDLLVNWLFEESGTRDMSMPAPTVLESEAWLLAGLRWHNNAEYVEEPKAEFAKHWSANNGKVFQAGTKKLSNHLDAVRGVAASSDVDVDNLTETCVAFASIMHKLRLAYPNNA